MDRGLSARHLTYRRERPDAGGREILRDVSLCVDPGRAVRIQGPTGAGKTTLLHLLATLIRPTEGEVVADGKPVSRWSVRHRDLWRRDVGIVFQQPYLLGRLTVLENVLTPLVPRGIPLDVMRRRALGRLAEMGVDGLAGADPRSLSGGECQRVAVARALVSRPAYLLLDEPTAFQDDPGVGLLVAALNAEKDRGAAVILCSHDPRLDIPGLFSASYHLAGARLYRSRRQADGTGTDR